MARGILIFERDDRSRAAIAGHVQAGSFRPLPAASAEDAARICETGDFDVAVVGIDEAPLDALEIIARARQTDGDYRPVITLGDPRAFGERGLGAFLGARDGHVDRPIAGPPLLQQIRALKRVRVNYQRLVANAGDLPLAVSTPTLPGLYNRRFLSTRLQESFDAAVTRDEDLAIVVVDLDGFDAVNRTHGYDVGDRVLAEVGAFFRDRAALSDTVCRYGGEELVLVMPRADGVVAALRAEALRRELASTPLRVPRSEAGDDTLEITLTASFGVAHRARRTLEVGDLVRIADEAVQVAKRDGRDRVVLGGH